jgi:PAS domain S-box-containing protein
MSSTNSSGWIPQLALAEHRLALLQSVTASLARAQSAHEVATVIMREALPGLQAEVGVIALLEPDGRTLRNIGFEGVGEATRDEWATYPVDSPVPVAEAALTGQLVVVPTREERNRRYPILAAVHGPDKGGPVVALPLKVEGRLNGVLGLCFGEDRGFTHQDMDFLKALADQSAIALERARLSLESSAALARLRLASDAGGFGIYERALNADLPVWENDLMYEIFGRERAAGPIGYREFRNEIVHPDDRSAYEAALARGAAEGGPVQFECRIRRRDEYRWLRLTGRVQGAADDRRLIGVMRDVTAEKSAIESLTQTAASLRQSQDVLRLAMRAGRMGAWWRDLSTEKVWWSRELEEIFGLPPGSFEGTKGGFRGLIHEEDRARFVDTVDRAIAARTEYAVEFRFRHASGEWRWMDGRGAAAYGPDGRPSALHGVGIDITDRKQAEEALRKSEERLRLTYQATGMGAWEWNAATNEVYWSPQYRELYGLDPESAPDYEAGMANVAAADRPAIESALAAALTNGAEFRSEHRIAHPERGERWILAIGNVLKDRESGATRMVGVVMDITARKRIEEALREEDRRKDEFLATLAHELRNPLAPISNAVHIIRLPDAPPDAQQAAREVIGRQVEQMVRLIDDLLDVSRISRGKLELRTEPVPLVGVLDRALETSMPHMRGHDLTVSLPQEPLTVQGDPVHRDRHRSGAPADAVPHVLPGAAGPRAHPRRPRHRSRAVARPCRDARRHHRSAQRRAGPGQRVHRDVAARLGTGKHGGAGRQAGPRLFPLEAPRAGGRRRARQRAVPRRAAAALGQRGADGARR